ncbi:hypothetical protein CRU87_01250 [Aliarcobacter trophiarum LMG 25534]|uniref:Membrane protein n=1 Tax=Aliarcobacter trophiarum LMG 25534 TaxID=1032241 RepID=A0AAD0VLQ0_9BACT|nr:hypothetical protein [Aliarcobacter trophiarum]AXK48181.1 putative membrane protein [Aliarcobacter trophiarum LMG 25534]RXI28447.1 hypothetical protein CRU89_00400 [Aliarcobacter trophiarum]RXJ93144.1 hypothetical protein CRU87_01250 [Aliarcobacter trophiarum LMG 25534]
MKSILLSVVVIALFTACSGKKYYEPEETSSNIELNKKSMSSSIKSMNKIGATLEDNEIITKKGISSFQLPEGFEFINFTEEGEVIATNYIDKILLGTRERKVKDVVVAAAKRDEKLALIYSNNSMELIDINTDKTLFKEYLPLSLANDTRVANPIFMGSLILFPTLNGKVLILSSATNEVVRNISVDTDSDFKNIISLEVEQKSESLIVANAHKVVAISARDIISKEYDIRDIIIKNGYIYIATVDGNIIKLTPNLEEVAKRKYKYAKFHALAYGNSLYAVESQGFLINISDDFRNDTVYEFSFDNEKRLIAIDNKVYFNSDYITLP